MRVDFFNKIQFHSDELRDEIYNCKVELNILTTDVNESERLLTVCQYLKELKLITTGSGIKLHAIKRIKVVEILKKKNNKKMFQIVLLEIVK